jgi:type II secretory pathway pseudopilin PulG
MPAGSAGFGMIEIVVAMFLLAVLAIALLPLLISSAQLSSKNVTLATATQLVNEQMDVVRKLGKNCAVITTHANETVGLLDTDPRGTVLAMTRLAGACPSTFPGTIDFTAQVSVEGTVDVLAEATTSIYVTSANPVSP